MLVSVLFRSFFSVRLKLLRGRNDDNTKLKMIKQIYSPCRHNYVPQRNNVYFEFLHTNIDNPKYNFKLDLA